MKTSRSKVNRRDGQRGRTYEIDGRSYPSVTTVLSVIAKPALVPWSAKVEREMVITAAADLYLDCAETPPMTRIGWVASLRARLGREKANQKELAKAAEIGSQAHALIEWNLKSQLCAQPGPAPRIGAKAMWAFAAWERWSQSVNLKPIMIEQVCWSENFGFAGTFDLMAEVNGRLTLLDWKTGKRVYAEAHLQNAAYRAAVREMGHGDIGAGMIVRLPKLESDPEFEVVEAMPEPICLPVFLDALRVWTWREKCEQEKTQTEEALWNKPTTANA